MLKRNIAILIAGGLLGAQANLAGAGDSNVYILPAQLKYLEERAASVRAEAQAQGYVYTTAEARGDADRMVKINASTKYVNAEHLQTVKFVNDKGQSFTWKADAAGVVVPLKTIAPAGFEAGEATVYVRHPTEHIGS